MRIISVKSVRINECLMGRVKGINARVRKENVPLFAILELSGIFQDQKPQAAEFMRVRNWKGI